MNNSTAESGDFDQALQEQMLFNLAEFESGKLRAISEKVSRRPSIE